MVGGWFNMSDGRGADSRQTTTPSFAERRTREENSRKEEDAGSGKFHGPKFPLPEPSEFFYGTLHSTTRMGYNICHSSRLRCTWCHTELNDYHNVYARVYLCGRTMGIRLHCEECDDEYLNLCHAKNEKPDENFACECEADEVRFQITNGSKEIYMLPNSPCYEKQNKYVSATYAPTFTDLINKFPYPDMKPD